MYLIPLKNKTNPTNKYFFFISVQYLYYQLWPKDAAAIGKHCHGLTTIYLTV
jgi:hypothetical protein